MVESGINCAGAEVGYPPATSLAPVKFAAIAEACDAGISEKFSVNLTEIFTSNGFPELSPAGLTVVKPTTTVIFPTSQGNEFSALVQIEYGTRVVDVAKLSVSGFSIFPKRMIEGLTQTNVRQIETTNNPVVAILRDLRMNYA